MFTDWYRVEMTIANDTSEGLFDGFDWEMTNLHNISACEAGSVGTSISAHIIIHQFALNMF